MKKQLTFGVTLFILAQSFIYAHCQVPCGIYDDAARIVQLREDFSTIQKAMNQIASLNNKSDAQSLNQATRWIMTKETHANNIQNIVSSYFLTQRIKIKSGKEFDSYASLATSLHQILVSAMKCKQTVDIQHVQIGLNRIDAFIEIYFDEHGKKHLKELDH